MLGKKYDDVFPGRHSFIVVIHVNDKMQALEQSEIAINNGAGGIFLINHGMPWNELLSIYKDVREAHKDAWIGVNCLDLTPAGVVDKFPDGLDGIWSDRSGVDDDLEFARMTREFMEERSFEGLYFGGVDFKYQSPAKDLEKAAREAVKYMDVVTTSGPGTGMQPPVEKVKVMKSAIENGSRLAVASGMTVDNVKDYATADCFLVGTGISVDFHHLDPAKVAAFARKIDGIKHREIRP
jgi:hypothetical protein